MVLRFSQSLSFINPIFCVSTLLSKT